MIVQLQNTTTAEQNVLSLQIKSEMRCGQAGSRVRMFRPHWYCRGTWSKHHIFSIQKTAL